MRQRDTLDAYRLLLFPREMHEHGEIYSLMSTRHYATLVSASCHLNTMALQHYFASLSFTGINDQVEKSPPHYYVS